MNFNSIFKWYDLILRGAILGAFIWDLYHIKDSYIHGALSLLFLHVTITKYRD